ncbi:hypothetical protein HDU67_006588 [Dinochytrium kinnereticum]|nr:hypothetical protein HDU67_006588 [Dinochytrium kinnereticum]
MVNLSQVITASVLIASTMVSASIVRRQESPSPVTSGSFSVLTYNVAGLPGLISSGNPDKNTPEMGRRIRAFDVVNVQEDFNYHAALYAADDHPYRTATSGGAGIGSGLNQLSRFPFIDDGRVRWDKCNGLIGDGNDCLTPKGFTVIRVRLEYGVYVDVYNLHADAGDSSADYSARISNIKQLSDYINANSAGNAVLVFGDTNTRYTRDDGIRQLQQNSGLTDPWIELIRKDLGIPPINSPALVCSKTSPDNTCEVVDKIFYRPGRFVALRAVDFQNQFKAFLDANGSPLSDHNPYSARFNWSLASNIRLSEQVGGPHGQIFSDLAVLPSNPSSGIRAITLRGGSRLDRISLTRTDGVTYSHGGSGGSDRTLTLNVGEHFVQATIASGKKDGRTRVFYAKFVTSQGRSVVVGSLTSDVKTFNAPDGWKIVGFWGRKGSEVDRLGVIFAPF